METHSGVGGGEGHDGGDVSKEQKTLSLTGLWRSSEISEGNTTEREKKTKTPTEYRPNCNSQQRSSPEAYFCHKQAGAEQGGTGCIT